MKRLFAILLVFLLVPVGAMGASIVDIDSVVDNSDCAVTVYFDNPLGGNTTFAAFHENYEWSGSSVVMGQAPKNQTSYTFFDLAPGETYTIFVMNEMDVNSADSFDYTVCTVPEYDSDNIRLADVNLCYFRPDSVQGDYGYNYAKNLSVRKVQKLLDEQMFMIKADFRHKVYRSDFEQRLLTVIKSPTGHVATNATTVTIYKNCTGFWQTTMYMNDAFQEMIEANGSVPSGRYDIEIYLEGMLLGTDSFTIKND